jgi:hypothetical protein
MHRSLILRSHVGACDNIYVQPRGALSAYSDLDFWHIRSLGYVPLRSGGTTSMIQSLVSTILCLSDGTIEVLHKLLIERGKPKSLLSTLHTPCFPTMRTPIAALYMVLYPNKI